MFVLVEMEPITPPARGQPDGARTTSASAAAPRCHACETLITQGKVISAGGERCYHVDCFVCATCDEPLQEGQYAEHTDGDMYCQEHYAEVVGSATNMCGHCGEPIAGCASLFRA